MTLTTNLTQGGTQTLTKRLLPPPGGSPNTYEMPKTLTPDTYILAKHLHFGARPAATPIGAPEPTFAAT